ncbi:MAG TPA: helix-turn-helix transcriptional regulator [Solirubrobacterales bacterium]|nr:helix-turn-helix transcriptional regulator [Solirubrobacterales bacterium]
MGQSKIGQVARIGRALAHPMRVKVLDVLGRTGKASPADLSRAGIGDLPHVNYHTLELAKLGFVRVKSERPVRGATEHFYVLTPLGQLVIGLMADLPDE